MCVRKLLFSLCKRVIQKNLSSYSDGNEHEIQLQISVLPINHFSDSYTFNKSLLKYLKSESLTIFAAWIVFVAQ